MGDYVDKQKVIEKIDEILFGYKFKNVDQLVTELNKLKKQIINYREKYRCSTCKDYPCSSYEAGCRDCSGWK